MVNIAEVLKEPIVPFVILLLVTLTVPIIFERFKIPGLVGLLAAGVFLGPYGLQLLDNKMPTMELLSDIGLLYLMFVAGLEIDIQQFRKKKNRSIGFGSLTFAVPMITGILVGRIFSFDWNASVLIGSLLASHTLLAYPIISRLGVVNNESVMVTIGATIFTDIGALLVLAICVAINAGEFSVISFLILLGNLAIYTTIVLFGFDWAGKEFFRRTGDEEGNQFLFVLLAVFLAALGAQLIGVEKIIGAFLAGLAVNEAVGEGAVKDKVLFIGSVLFIPIFFVDLGLLINLPIFLKSVLSVTVPLTIVIALIGSKGIAAYLAKLIYRYNNQEFLTMWSLSMPQVGATLAATLVGYRVGMLTEEILNSVIVLMLVTSTLGPLITSKAAVGLTIMSKNLAIKTFPKNWGNVDNEIPLTVVVPVYNPDTERYLIEMAALLVQGNNGHIIPLTITPPHTNNMDAPQLEVALQRSEILLESATTLAKELEVKSQPMLRIDDDIPQSIVRVAREQKANLIVMGWGKRTGLRARLFGNVIDSVLWTSHCPVAVTRLLQEPSKIQRVLVPVENLNSEAIRLVQFAQALGDAQLEITVLHLYDKGMNNSGIAEINSQLSPLVAESQVEGRAKVKIEVRQGIDMVKDILRASDAVDLVVLRSTRNRTSAGLAVSDVTTQLLGQLNCSIVMLGEPCH
ncbi:sodium:proton antiporter [Oscillatoriales cyanobacterium USR001]|nr:sodium:proton antiporter [Oscillatoriales cyanobacterium USR001]